MSYVLANNKLGINMSSEPTPPFQVQGSIGGSCFWSAIDVSNSGYVILPSSTVVKRIVFTCTFLSNDRLFGGLRIINQDMAHGATWSFVPFTGHQITFSTISGIFSVTRSAGDKNWDFSGWASWT